MDVSRLFAQADRKHLFRRPREPVDSSLKKHYSLKFSEELQDAYTDAVRDRKRIHYGQQKYRSPVQEHDRENSPFQKELQKAQQRIVSAVPPDLRSRSRLENVNGYRQLAKDLQKTSRLLECEKAQKIALKKRLEEVEHRSHESSKSRKNDLLAKRYGHQIRKLQDEVKRYQAELETERRKGERLQDEVIRANKDDAVTERYEQGIRVLQEEVKMCRSEIQEERMKSQLLQEELEAAKKENKKYQEKMQLLMFQHLPTTSKEFKDVGPVNHEAKESKGRIGNYRLGKKLGEGHYGVVQVGTHVTTKQNYAVKILDKERIKRFKDMQQISMEVHVLKHYPHPNIIRLQNVIHAEENIYLMTELCLMDLHKYHNDIGLTEEGAKQVILGILRPLQHLHSHGICHLDLKPENILLAQTVDLQNVTIENVRLCDFGLVSMAKDSEPSKDVIRKGYACGTPGFFAPEMILKNEFEGRTADMWSLGCIILEITLGFTQEWIDSYEQVESDPAAFQEGLEDCLLEISRERYPHHQNLLDNIHRCLTIDPGTRISSADALAHPWLDEVAEPDENRQDFVLASRRQSSSSRLYAERSFLMASAIAC